MRILILLLSMSLLFGCSSRAYIPSGLSGVGNGGSRLLVEVLGNDKARYDNKLSYFFDWSDLKRKEVNEFDGPKCINGDCGIESIKNAARMYVIYYIGSRSGNIKELGWNKPWWSYLTSREYIDLLKNKDFFISSYKNDSKIYKIAILSESDLINASMEIFNLINTVVMEKENEEIKIKKHEEIEIAKISSMPRERCGYTHTGRGVVDKLIDIVNREDVTCLRDGESKIDMRINNRKTFMGNDRDGLIYLALLSDVIYCQAPWWSGGQYEYNECVASVAKGLSMWLSLTRDRAIPDSAFQHCPSYGNELDFASCAIYIWQYKRIKQ